MGDRIAVLNKGHIIQVGAPEDIYDRPATTFVAQLVGTPRINLVEANRENNTLYVANSAIHLPMPAGDDLSPSFLLGVRPEDVQPHSDGDFPGQVILIEPLGVETILHIQTGEQTLLSLISGMTDLRMGDQVRFNIVRERLHYFRPDGTRINVKHKT